MPTDGKGGIRPVGSPSEMDVAVEETALTGQLAGGHPRASCVFYDFLECFLFCVVGRLVFGVK